MLLPALLAAGVAACAGQVVSRGPERLAISRSALRVGPLTELVPAAGLRWLVVVQPARLWQDAAFAEDLALLFAPERLRAFAHSTGIHPQHVETALVAGYAFGTLVLVAPPGERAAVRRAFERRARDHVTIERRDPQVLRLKGLVGGSAQSLLHVEAGFAAFAVDDPTLARIVELYASRRLTRSPTALEGAALRSLAGTFGDSPLRAYAPGPFPAAWHSGLRGLLGTATAVGLGATIHGHQASVLLRIEGDWDAFDADARLRAAWGDLATSGLGRLVGLDRPVSGPSFEATGEALTVRLVLQLTTLARGLRAAVLADVDEMMHFESEPAAAAPRP